MDKKGRGGDGERCRRTDDRPIDRDLAEEVDVEQFDGWFASAVSNDAVARVITDGMLTVAGDLERPSEDASDVCDGDLEAPRLAACARVRGRDVGVKRARRLRDD
jgi:hypothetical protein